MTERVVVTIILSASYFPLGTKKERKKTKFVSFLFFLDRLLMQTVYVCKLNTHLNLICFCTSKLICIFLFCFLWSQLHYQDIHGPENSVILALISCFSPGRYTLVFMQWFFQIWFGFKMLQAWAYRPMKAILLKIIRKWIEATVVNLPKKIFEKITQFNESHIFSVTRES